MAVQTGPLRRPTTKAILRPDVERLARQGLKPREIARQVGCSETYAREISKPIRAEGADSLKTSTVRAIESRLRAGEAPETVAVAVGRTVDWVRIVGLRAGLLEKAPKGPASIARLTWSADMLAELEPLIAGERGIGLTAERLGVAENALIHGLITLIRQERHK